MEKDRLHGAYIWKITFGERVNTTSKEDGISNVYSNIIHKSLKVKINK